MTTPSVQASLSIAARRARLFDLHRALPGPGAPPKPRPRVTTVTPEVAQAIQRHAAASLARPTPRPRLARVISACALIGGTVTALSSRATPPMDSGTQARI